ncbi:efflux RND transporter periplasmic adaptor subunit [Paraburkholderia solisilvae]|uniref:Multidrug resistance protein MdtE n=1 Tax=Paraburkholderia solisilvae TaxID=624376 RepID=A0A6J5DS87_9BURK|nr:efflux RND transporter periplasmic adaptor subunit [Paraburkholderia solisilvae]CAB3756354.1 Multidrug resistance protein MdtE [Paraburkholderia solisilvae]
MKQSSKPFSARRKTTVAATVVMTAAVLGASVQFLDRPGAAKASEPAALTEIDAAPVLQKNIVAWQSYSGRLEAVERVDVKPLVAGTIVAVHFRDGALVRKGDPLFTIDPRPYAAEVDRAQAQLAAAQARSDNAATDAARAQRLIDDNAIARRDFDLKQNAAHEAAADLRSARAALESARIKLSYTQIAAPVSGRVSRAELTVGNIVSAGANAPLLTTLVSTSPIYASFDVDEKTYLRYLGRAGHADVPARLGLADESGFSYTGSVASVDNQLDPQSGTIRVRARFDNADGTLVPGLFARVKIGGDTPHDTLLIPDEAISTDQDKKFVLVVSSQNRLEYREIVPGDLADDGLRVVTRGLSKGERIVVAGMQRVRPGDQVRIRPVSIGG